MKRNLKQKNANRDEGHPAYLQVENVSGDSRKYRTNPNSWKEVKGLEATEKTESYARMITIGITRSNLCTSFEARFTMWPIDILPILT